MINLSIAITVHNEGEMLQQCINSFKHQRIDGDEVIILDDFSDDMDTRKILDRNEVGARVIQNKFMGNFADHKNFLNGLCKNPWILQLDADEETPEGFLSILRDVIETNEGVDAFRIARINTVEGITANHIHKWQWRINDEGWINWPDYQTRLYRNDSNIKWVCKVHEQLVGTKAYSILPMDPQLALIHRKTIDRQEKQNELYDRICREG